MIVGIKQATKKGYIEMELPGVCDLSYPSSTLRRGRVQEGGTVSPTICCIDGGVYEIEENENMGDEKKPKWKIRKLTTLETSRLMGVRDSDFMKMTKVESNSQLYKAHGNSIVVPCLEALFRNLNIKGVKNWDQVKDNYDAYKDNIKDCPEAHSN